MDKKLLWPKEQHHKCENRCNCRKCNISDTICNACSNWAFNKDWSLEMQPQIKCSECRHSYHINCLSKEHQSPNSWMVCSDIDRSCYKHDKRSIFTEILPIMFTFLNEISCEHSYIQNLHKNCVAELNSPAPKTFFKSCVFGSHTYNILDCVKIESIQNTNKLDLVSKTKAMKSLENDDVIVGIAIARIVGICCFDVSKDDDNNECNAKLLVEYYYTYDEWKYAERYKLPKGINKKNILFFASKYYDIVDICGLRGKVYVCDTKESFLKNEKPSDCEDIFLCEKQIFGNENNQLRVIFNSNKNEFLMEAQANILQSDLISTKKRHPDNQYPNKANCRQYENTEASETQNHILNQCSKEIKMNECTASIATNHKSKRSYFDISEIDENSIPPPKVKRRKMYDMAEEEKYILLDECPMDEESNCNKFKNRVQANNGKRNDNICLTLDYNDIEQSIECGDLVDSTINNKVNNSTCTLSLGFSKISFFI